MEVNQACMDVVMATFWSFTLPVMGLGLMGCLILTVALWPRKKTILMHVVLTENEQGELQQVRLTPANDGLNRMAAARLARPPV